MNLATMLDYALSAELQEQEIVNYNHNGGDSTRASSARAEIHDIFLLMPQLHTQALDEQSAPAGSPPLHILLVDDDPLILAGTAEMLEDDGHSVTQAASGAQALRILADHPAIELLITDNRMPGLSGAELIAHARQAAPALPILLMTGYDRRGDDIGDDVALLTKPFRAAKLLATVRELWLSTAAWSG